MESLIFMNSLSNMSSVLAAIPPINHYSQSQKHGLTSNVGGSMGSNGNLGPSSGIGVSSNYSHGGHNAKSSNKKGGGSNNPISFPKINNNMSSSNQYNSNQGPGNINFTFVVTLLKNV
jgi:hypothetical protein